MFRKNSLLKEPILEEEKRPTVGRLSKTKNALGYIASITLAAAGSVQFAINAFLYPSHITPSEINRSWYEKLPLRKKIFSFTNGVSSLIINTIINYRTIPKAWKMLLTLDFRRNPKKIFTYFILSISAACSSAAIGYINFLFGGWVLGVSAASLSLIVFSGTRFFGLIKLDEKNNIQNQIIKNLKLMKNEHKERINEELEYTELNNEALIHVILMAEEIIANDPSYIDRNSYENIKSWIDCVIATTTALSICPIFAQKLIDGFEIIVPISAIKSMSTTAIIAKNIASIPLSSGTPALYFSQTFNFRQTIENSWSYLKNRNLNFKKKGLLIFLYLSALGMNALASTSNYNLVENIVKSENNIFQWLIRENTVELFGYLSAFAAFIVNTKLSLEQINDIFIKSTINVENPDISDVIKWLEQNPLSEVDQENIQAYRLRRR